MDFPFWQLCILVAISISSVVFALRVAVNFDLNAWLERRDERRVRRVRALCPHVTLKAIVDPSSGRTKIEATGPVSPPLSWDYICQRCGFRFTGGEDQAQAVLDLYGENPARWMKKEKRFVKAAKKLGRKGLL